MSDGGLIRQRQAETGSQRGSQDRGGEKTGRTTCREKETKQDGNPFVSLKDYHSDGKNGAKSEGGRRGVCLMHMGAFKTEEGKNRSTAEIERVRKTGSSTPPLLD